MAGIDTAIVGVVGSVEGSVAKVKLCLPNTSGALVMSQESELVVPLCDLNVFDAEVIKNANVKAYSSTAEVKVGEKAVEVRDAEGKLEDYRDVTFEGMASTFRSVTPEDRDGDYIMEGAFTKWIGEFRRNPVMLIDHERCVESLMGYYSRVNVIAGRGLAVEGRVTNSPTDEAKHVRFQLVEGALKTLSIGGSFFYMDDMRGIEEVRLHEISLVVIPANPDAMITTRPVTAKHAERVMKMHLSQNGGELRGSIKKSLT
jgi:HK97 family phage prohead protease